MSSSRYHVNSKTGEPGKCQAVKGVCPYGGTDSHFSSTVFARKAFELFMSEGRDSVRKTVWAEVSNEQILNLDSSLALQDQLALLGFDRASEGAKTALAWRKFWLKCLSARDLEGFKSRELEGTENTRIGGTALLLVIMANRPEQNPPHCEYPACKRGYFPDQPDDTELQVDHKVSWAETKDNSLDNLQVLCSFHHALQDTGSKADVYKFRDNLASGTDPNQLTLFES